MNDDDAKFDENGYLLGENGKPIEMKMTRSTRLVLRMLAWLRALRRR